jgi:hypothetical protein
MVLTAAQTVAFFREEAQMGIPHPTVAQMQAEGITNVQDIADFDKESLQQLADNLRRPGGRLPNRSECCSRYYHPNFGLRVWC